MRVTVLFFGHYRDIGGDARELELPKGSTVRDAANFLTKSDPRMQMLGTHCRAAINEEYMPAETCLNDGDELAFIPPMSGG